MPDKIHAVASLFASPFVTLWGGLVASIALLSLSITIGKKGGVSDTLCGERREAYQQNLETKVDAIANEQKRQAKETSDQWDMMTEIRDATIETRTLVRERGKHA